MVEVLMLGPRRDDFFDVVARQYFGGEVVGGCVFCEREKRQKSKMPFSKSN